MSGELNRALHESKQAIRQSQQEIDTVIILINAAMLLHHRHGSSQMQDSEH